MMDEQYRQDRIRKKHRKQIYRHIEINEGMSAITSHLHDVIDYDEITQYYSYGKYLRYMINTMIDDGLIVEVKGRWYVQ